jgi:hypothetical protein
MATDPEARSSGNSAVVIAVVALVLIVGLAFLFFNRGAGPDDTTIVNNPAPSVNTETTKEVPVPVPGNTTIVTPPAGGSGSSGSASSGGGASTPAGGSSK